MSASAVYGRRLGFAGALLLTAAFAAPAYADVEVVVVTAEKRAADVQTVPVAISVFTSEKRDAVGINSVQDMTNFTPGLAYQTSLDRVFLRGVGRQVNSQSADTPVANYDDGLFETFAVAAGRSSLELDRVEVLRGPQGTLSGRNALAGALNQITRRPQTDTFHGEARLTIGSYEHITPEVELTGPLDDVWAFRIYAQWDYQADGWAKNSVPIAEQGATRDPMWADSMGQSFGSNRPTHVATFHTTGDDGNVINTWYWDGQIQAKFNDHFEMWTKLQGAQWNNGAGGPGADLEGWTPADYPTFEAAQGGLFNNAGYGCTQLVGGRYFTNDIPAVSKPTNIVTQLGANACNNPGINSPWHQARLVQTRVRLPSYWALDSQWTWHADGFDIKYIGGGTYYRYHLSTMDNVWRAPITSYQINGFNIDNRWTFNPEEENSFISNEINLISTGDSPFQWVLGGYQFTQQANQPGDLFNANQPEVNANAGPGTSTFGGGLLGAAAFCSGTAILGGNGVGTNGVCAPWDKSKTFDSYNNIHDHSYAAFGQIDYNITPEIKLTGGLRYSKDRKFGSEWARVPCYFGFCAAFGAAPDQGIDLPPEFGGIPRGFLAQPIDTTQTGIVVASGVPVLPQGVVGPTKYDPNTGYATRHLNAEWDGITGTAGVEWQPDDKTLAFIKYSRGYKDGGYYEGANTALVTRPFTDKENVDSIEGGIKRTWGDWLTTNLAVFHYQYKNLQLPLTFINIQGVVTLPQTSFFNVPGSISQGAELEVTANPFEDLNVLFNYSYDDAHVSKGTAIDPADPTAVDPRAKPLVTDAQCLASSTTATPLCAADVYTLGGALGAPISGITTCPNPPAAQPEGCVNTRSGWIKPQSIVGNILPNAARHKIALNVQYDIHSDWGVFTPSVSYVWRGSQYGTLFTRSYNQAPSWDQVDLRVRWVSDDGNYEFIVFGKNITDSHVFDVGAIGTRVAGTNNFACVGGGVPGAVFGINVPGLQQCNFVQGLNGPTGFGRFRGEDDSGHVKTYQVAPPALFGLEFHWKFL